MQNISVKQKIALVLLGLFICVVLLGTLVNLGIFLVQKVKFCLHITQVTSKEDILRELEVSDKCIIADTY